MLACALFNQQNKEPILLSIITWFVLRKQNVQAKKVYCLNCSGSARIISSLENYSMFEKEALAIIFAVKKFHQYLSGLRFILLTDHKPLTYISLSSYYLASNSEAEPAVRIFKEAKKVIKNEPGTQTENLARFLLSYRTNPHSATGCPPAEILMGRRPRTRLELLSPDFSPRMVEKRTLDISTPAIH